MEKKTVFAIPNQAIYHFYAPIYDRLFGAVYASARRRSAQLATLNRRWRPSPVLSFQSADHTPSDFPRWT